MYIRNKNNIIENFLQKPIDKYNYIVYYITIEKETPPEQLPTTRTVATSL